MSIREIVVNDLVQDESTVWLLKGHDDFDYSDGAESEKYLDSVLRKAKDLSSRSSELESCIKDWPSEYHLTVKRAQLLAGFDFDPSLKVLEVGCGCGAITRYLSETFNDVISVEGSIKRARLARLRTRDRDNVSIICAPFQEIEFAGKFDVIFCIGVYEYSASFVSGEDPYDSVLSYFSDLLTPNGFVVLAIENQFGLKYFNATREDHTGKRYVGLEGYHAHKNKVKTFGKYELESKLSKYYSDIKFYYPYPDYKIPDCVIAEEFLLDGRAGELVSQIRSRDYFGKSTSLWDSSCVSLELARNKMLPFFSDSFLVFAGKSEMSTASFDQLCISFSSRRIAEFTTKTRIYYDSNGAVTVSKQPLAAKKEVSVGKLTLVESFSLWKDSYSLQTILQRNCQIKSMKLDDIFMPCLAWVKFLENFTESVDGEKYLDGKYIDCIFPNIYMDSSGVSFIDTEWVWNGKINLNVLVIRSIFIFFYRIGDSQSLAKVLQVRSLKKIIIRIANSLGIKLRSKDFSDFIKLEIELQSLVYSYGKLRTSLLYQYILFDRPSYYFFLKLRSLLMKGKFFFKKIIAIKKIFRGANS